MLIFWHLQAELGSWAAMAKEFPGASDITDKIKSFQDWLSGYDRLCDSDYIHQCKNKMKYFSKKFFAYVNIQVLIFYIF